MVKNLQSLIDGISKAWCQATHPDPMWPVQGMYRCPKCMRQYPVPWEARTNEPVPITMGREAARVQVVRGGRRVSPQVVA